MTSNTATSCNSNHPQELSAAALSSLPSRLLERRDSASSVESSLSYVSDDDESDDAGRGQYDWEVPLTEDAAKFDAAREDVAHSSERDFTWSGGERSFPRRSASLPGVAKSGGTGSFTREPLLVRSQGKEGASVLIFNHHSKYLVAWDRLLALFCLYTAIYLPLSLVFPEVLWPGSEAFDNLLDALYFVDIFVKLRTSFTERGIVVIDVPRIRAHYLRTWFALDCISSCFPIGIIVSATAQGQARQMVRC